MSARRFLSPPSRAAVSVASADVRAVSAALRSAVSVASAAAVAAVSMLSHMSTKSEPTRVAVFFPAAVSSRMTAAWSLSELSAIVVRALFLSYLFKLCRLACLSVKLGERAPRVGGEYVRLLGYVAPGESAYLRVHHLLGRVGGSCGRE